MIFLAGFKSHYDKDKATEKPGKMVHFLVIFQVARKSTGFR